MRIQNRRIRTKLERKSLILLENNEVNSILNEGIEIVEVPMRILLIVVQKVLGLDLLETSRE